ncbi:DUF5134 domain-containing protein [Streptomyces sp. NPDC004647]|uniref:DUF5134 domain-containing protein n=1 Tax=Streptomyces sp. NPDC004647 TaxID=3154671 RepID=UPI0033AC525C
MSGLVLGWSLAVIATVVAVGSLVRMALVDGSARHAAAAETVMAGGMAGMSAPPTAGAFGDQAVLWAAVFAAVGLGALMMSVRDAIRRGWRHFHHWAHHVVGGGAMVLMTLAMPGASSGPVLALGASHGGAHGMQGMESMPGMDSMHGMAGLEGMHVHSIAGAAASSGSTTVWRLAFGALALYFLISVALSVRARLRDARQPTPAVTSSAARHSRPRRSRGLSAPNAALVGQVGMGGCMATMLIMMAA